MRHRVGLNIHGNDFSTAQLTDMAGELNARSHLVINAFDKAAAMHDAMEGQGIIVARDWPDDWPPRGLSDNEIQNKYDQLRSRWIEKRNGPGGHPDVYQYFPNEPDVSSSNIVPFLHHLCRFIEKLTDADIPAVVGNFAWSKSLHWDDVQKGRWDEFLRVTSQWTRNYRGYVGGHDYTTGALPWGCADRDIMEHLYDDRVARMPPALWPTWDEIYTARERNYLLFRWVMLAHRAEEIGVEMPLMLITEGFWDRMPNLEVPLNGQRSIMEQMEALAGVTLRGPLDQRALFQHLWPEWSDTDAALAQLQWCEDTYPSYVHGFHLFAANYSNDWTTFNFMEWPDLLARLSTIAPCGERSDTIEESDSSPVPGTDTDTVFTFRAATHSVETAGDYNVFLRKMPTTIANLPVTHLRAGKSFVLTMFPDYPPVGENQFVPVTVDQSNILWVSRSHVIATPLEGEPELQQAINTVHLRQDLFDYRLHKAGIRF